MIKPLGMKFAQKVSDSYLIKNKFKRNLKLMTFRFF